MTAAPVDVVIVEDDAAVAESLVALLESTGRSALVFGDGEAFLRNEAAGRARCIVLDVRLPGCDGLSVLAALRAGGRAPPVIVMTGHGDVPMAVRALRGGAVDFIEKPIDGDALLGRIEAALAATDAASLEKLDCLTRRERQVMIAVTAGESNKAIALRLGVSPKTVELHRARVMQKTGCENLPQLVRLAINAGFDEEQNDRSPRR